LSAADATGDLKLNAIAIAIVQQAVAAIMT
jgi:hypothetical protein